MSESTPDPVSAANARQSAFYASLGANNDRDDITTGNGHTHQQTPALAESTPDRELIATTYEWLNTGGIHPADAAVIRTLLTALEAAHEVHQPNREALVELAAHAIIDAKYPDIAWSLITGESRELRLKQGAAAVGAILAALPIPATGEAQWEYGALTPDKLGMDVMVDDGTIPVLDPPEQIYRRRKAGAWEVTS